MYKVSFYNIVISEERNTKIIYNSISKAYIQIPNNMNLTDYTKEINKNEHVLNENDYLLINNGFIIEKDVDEITYLKMIYNKYFFDSKSLNIIMIPTFACNFNCHIALKLLQEMSIRKQIILRL